MHVGVCHRMAEEEETEDFRTQEELGVSHAKTVPCGRVLGEGRHGYVHSRCLAHWVHLGCTSGVACLPGVSGPHCHRD